MLLEHYRNWIRPQDDHATVWSGSIGEAMQVDAVTGGVYLTAKFEQHVQNLNNWKFRSDLLRIFPEAERFGIRICESI